MARRVDEPINLARKLALFDERFSPRIVATMNDYKIEVVKVEGEFVWHSHPVTDDFFFVLEGACIVMWKDGDAVEERRVGKWDMVNNPSGRIHALRNDGPGPCFFQVMLASPQPQRPQYDDEALLKLQRADDPDKK